jgi:hypothetical protein
MSLLEAVDFGDHIRTITQIDLPSKHLLADVELDENRLTPLVPAFINFAVTKANLIADFENWVDKVQAYRQKVMKAENRLFESLMNNWINNKCLPYFDLKLFAYTKRSRVSQRQYVDLLQLDKSKRLKDAVEQPRFWSDRAFSAANLSAINAELARAHMNGTGEIYPSSKPNPTEGL